MIEMNLTISSQYALGTKLHKVLPCHQKESLPFIVVPDHCQYSNVHGKFCNKPVISMLECYSTSVDSVCKLWEFIDMLLYVSLAWAYHSPTNVHIYSLVAEHISCSVMSLLV
jgi:hypothetical protein